MKTKVKRLFMTGMFLICMMMVYVVGINTYVTAKAKKHIVNMEQLENQQKNEDAIIILGAGIRADGSLSPMLKERLDMGIELYQQDVSDAVIMSGDHGSENYDEVNAMKNYAMEQGIPSERIFMDHAGFSTYETMYRAKEIFEVKTAVVVTQEYHMYRALYIAEKLGIEAEGVTCDTRKYPNDLYRRFREVLARNKDFLTTIIKPEPTYLGDAIPVSSDGDLTNDK